MLFQMRHNNSCDSSAFSEYIFGQLSHFDRPVPHEIFDYKKTINLYFNFPFFFLFTNQLKSFTLQAVDVINFQKQTEAGTNVAKKKMTDNNKSSPIS